jgi:hypothetical protein
MNKIIFPLRLRLQGPEVAHLQGGVQLLRERGELENNHESTDRTNCY